MKVKSMQRKVKMIILSLYLILIILVIGIAIVKPAKIEAKISDNVDEEFFPQAMGVYEKWSYTVGGSGSTSPAVADLDGDGTLEVIIGSVDNKLHCLNHLGGV